MTFYDDIEENVISDYEKENNRLIVYYLDGTSKTIIYTKEKENEILDSMLKQAILRDKFLYKDTIITNRLNHIFYMFSLFVGTYAISNEISLLLCISIVYNMLMLKETKESRYKLNELKKYREYLNLLALSKDKHTLAVECDDEEPIELNINEIDNFTYSEIKNMNKSYKKMLKQSRKN